MGGWRWIYQPARGWVDDDRELKSTGCTRDAAVGIFAVCFAGKILWVSSPQSHAFHAVQVGMPLLGFSGYDDKIYRATRARLLNATFNRCGLGTASVWLLACVAWCMSGNKQYSKRPHAAAIVSSCGKIQARLRLALDPTHPLQLLLQRQSIQWAGVAPHLRWHGVGAGGLLRGLHRPHAGGAGV